VADQPQHTALPAYMLDSSAKALDSAMPAVESRPAAKPAQRSARNPKVRAVSPAREKKNTRLVDLLLKEPARSSNPQHWPDEQPLRTTKRRSVRNVALNVAKVTVGAGLLTISGAQSLVKGWMNSELWVSNALKAIGLSLVSLHLLVSCIGIVNQLWSAHHDTPVVRSIYQEHKADNGVLKSKIGRIQSGEDSELLARDYLDMANPDEVLVKIQTPKERR
jgi:hypothetical protein